MTLIWVAAAFSAGVAFFECSQRKDQWDLRLIGALAPSAPQFQLHSSWSQLPPKDWKIGLELRFADHKVHFEPQGDCYLLTGLDRRSINLVRPCPWAQRLRVRWQPSGNFELQTTIRDCQRPVSGHIIYQKLGVSQTIRGRAFTIDSQELGADFDKGRAGFLPICVGQAPVVVASVLDEQLTRKGARTEGPVPDRQIPGFLQAESSEHIQRVQLAQRLSAADEETPPSPGLSLSPNFTEDTLGGINRLSTLLATQKLATLQVAQHASTAEPHRQLEKLLVQIVVRRLKFFERLGVGVPIQNGLGEGVSENEIEYPQD